MQILTIQRVATHKRPFDAVEIIKRVKKIHKVDFKWVGNGEKNDINKYTPALKSVGEWIPYVSEEEKWEMLKESQIFINTSELEGFNCGVGEALSIGIPVLVYDLPQYRDVYRDNLIYAAKVGDVNTFTITLKDVIQYYEEYKNKFSQKSIQFINQNYSVEKVTNRILHILEKVMNHESSR